MTDLKVMTAAELSAFLNLLRAADEGNRLSNAELSEIDKTKEDVLHYIEFESPEDSERAEAASVLHEILLVRREIKDAQEMTAPINRWVIENRAVIKSLERLLGELREIEKRHRARVYMPRTEIFDELKERYANACDARE